MSTAVIFLINLMLLSSCVVVQNNGSEAEPAAESVPTLVPAAVLPATSTVTPLPTNTATATPVPPTATAAPTETPVIAMFTPTTAPELATSTPLPTITPITRVPMITREIGSSIQGRPILDYQFKNGPHQVVIVGGIHGGYEWNSIVLAYDLIDYYSANPDLVPDTITLHIIPSANPDGQAVVAEGRFTVDDVTISLAETVPGRFNSNGVDLNRNWDCNWEPTAFWRNQQVSGGPSPFSERETIILRDFLIGLQPEVVVFLHSAANGVFAAGCAETGPRSLVLANLYGNAAGYPVYESFTAYPITGDAGDWLTTQGIPSFTVELKDHFNTDWSQNLAGMEALLAEMGALPVLNDE